MKPINKSKVYLVLFTCFLAFTSPLFALGENVDSTISLHVTNPGTGTDYTVLSTDDFILMTPNSADHTVTLPAIASNIGRLIKIRKTDSNFYKITVLPNGTDTINGQANTTLNTQNETIELIPDSSATNWIVISRMCNTEWQSYTPTLGGVTGTSTNTAYWRRVGDSMHVRGYFKATGTDTNTAAISLPSSGTSVSIDTTKVIANKTLLGTISNSKSSAVNLSTAGNMGAIFYDTTSASNVYLSPNANSNGTSSFYGLFSTSNVFDSTSHVSYEFTVPVSGWKSSLY